MTLHWPTRRPKAWLRLFDPLALAVFMLLGWRGIPVVGLGTFVFYLAQPEANHSLPALAALQDGVTSGRQKPFRQPVLDTPSKDAL